jgi:two-component system chemotaxis response regulator CheB
MSSSVPTKPLAPIAEIPGAAAPTLVPEQISFRPFSKTIPRVLLIGASTGGPQALTALVAGLDEVITSAPVLIAQHMPRDVTVVLADHLARASHHPAHEAIDGEPVRSGCIYLAPGGRHMRVTRRDGTAVIALDDGPPINFCRPSLDPLFSSAADVWGARVLGAVLTGMGHDGLQGAGAIVEAGGSVIAQDGPTSVVWGMPGAVAGAGLCSQLLPLGEMAPAIVRLFAGRSA